MVLIKTTDNILWLVVKNLLRVILVLVVLLIGFIAFHFYRVRPRHFEYKYQINDSNNRNTALQYAYRTASALGYTTSSLYIIQEEQNRDNKQRWNFYFDDKNEPFFIHVTFRSDKIFTEYQLNWK